MSVTYICNETKGGLDLSSVRDVLGNPVVLRPKGGAGAWRECPASVKTDEVVLRVKKAGWISIQDTRPDAKPLITPPPAPPKTAAPPKAVEPLPPPPPKVETPPPAPPAPIMETTPVEETMTVVTTPAPTALVETVPVEETMTVVTTSVDEATAPTPERRRRRDR